MSKAFTKDDDAATDPVLVSPRAPLPDGIPNYVTSSGLAALRAERDSLEEARRRVGDDSDRARTLAALGMRLAAIEERLGSAVLVDCAMQPRDEVRFGATVTLRFESGDARRYRIVGVDEADPAASRVAFVSPLARALLGKVVGDVATVRTPGGDEEVEVQSVAYEDRGDRP
jgi:transcription elongation factor GreB